jgi:hypothetical protein
MIPNATCAYTGQALTIRNDGTHPFINLDGHGGIYFVDEAAKHAWCQENVRWNPQTQCYEPKGGTVTINGTDVPIAATN